MKLDNPITMSEQMLEPDSGDFLPIDYNKILPETLNERGDIEIFDNEYNRDRIYSALFSKIQRLDFFNKLILSPNNPVFTIKILEENIEVKKKIYEEIKSKLTKRKTRIFIDYTSLPLKPEIKDNQFSFSIYNQHLKNYSDSLRNRIRKDKLLNGRVKVTRLENVVTLTFLKNQGDTKAQKKFYKETF